MDLLPIIFQSLLHQRNKQISRGVRDSLTGNLFLYTYNSKHAVLRDSPATISYSYTPECYRLSLRYACAGMNEPLLSYSQLLDVMFSSNTTRIHRLLLGFVCVLLMTVGCDRLSNRLSDKERQELNETLVGTWEIDTSSLSLSENAPVEITDKGPPSDPSGDAPSDREQVSSNMALAELFGLHIQFDFSKNGDFAMTIGEESYEGTWEIPQKDGERYVFVTKFPMKGILKGRKAEGISEESSKKLVERLHIIDKSTIEIEDDAGNRYRMKKTDNTPGPN